MAYLYAFIAGLSDLLAGLLVLQGPGNRLQPRYIIAFASGSLLGAAFFHILPELDLHRNGLFLALGFVVFYVLEKLMMIHACGEEECDTHRIGPIAVLGMALDNVVDGAGIMAGARIQLLLGLSIAIAVVLHEIPQGIASAFIMREARWKPRSILLILLLSGLLYPLGVLAAHGMSLRVEQALLAFVAGDFIYLGAGDLLPEAHRKFNWRVILFVVLGVTFMFALKVLLPDHA